MVSVVLLRQLGMLRESRMLKAVDGCAVGWREGEDNK